MHIHYEQYEEVRNTEDPSIKKLLKKNISEKERKEKTIANLDQRIKEYQAAQVKINTNAARFGSFLKYYYFKSNIFLVVQ